MSATYIDIAVNGAVREWVLNPGPAFVWSKTMDSVLWANASGTAMLGFSHLSDLLEKDFSQPSAFVQKLNSVVAHIDKVDSFSLSKLSGNKQLHLIGRMQKLNLSNDMDGIFISFDPNGDYKTRDQAPRLLKLFEDQPGCAAILGANGTLIADSGGMPLVHFNQDDLMQLHKDVDDSSDHLIKRAVRSSYAFHPAGIAKLNDGLSLLLIAAETIAAELKDQILVKAEQDEDINTPTLEDNPFQVPDISANTTDLKIQGNNQTTDIPQTLQYEAMERIVQTFNATDDTQYLQKRDEDKSDILPNEPKIIESALIQDDVSDDVSNMKPRRLKSDFFGGLDYWYFKNDTQDQDTALVPAKKIETEPDHNESEPISTNEDKFFWEKEAPEINVKKSIESEFLASKFENNSTVLLEDEQTDELIEKDKKTDPQFEFIKSLVPTRFTFTSDTEGTITDVSSQMALQIGPHAADIKNRTWDEIASKLDLDKGEEISKALKGQDTWSGHSVLWPIQGTDMHVPVDMAALPNFSHAHGFSGFKGFGVIHSQDAALDPKARGRKITGQEFWNDEEPAITRTMLNSELNIVGANDDSQLDQARDELNHDIVVPFQKPILADDAIANATPEVEDKASSQNKEPEGTALSWSDLQTIEKIAAKLNNDINHNSNVDTPDLVENKDLTAPENIPSLLEENASAIDQCSSNSDTSNMPLIQRLQASDNAIICFFHDEIVFANDVFLNLSGRKTIDDLNDEGDLIGLFAENLIDDDGPMTLTRADGTSLPVSAKLQSVLWDEASSDTDDALKVFMMTLSPLTDDDKIIETPQLESLQQNSKLGGTNHLASLENFESLDHDIATSNEDLAATLRLGLSVRQLHEILETATDGVVVLSESGQIHALNHSAEVLFGFETESLKGRHFSSLFAQDSQKSAMDYLDGLTKKGVESVLNDGRELTGFEASGGLIPLFVTIGRLAGERQEIASGFCAVLRDITQWKKVEHDLLEARREAEAANTQKSDFLAKISHEIRTPLNAIIGFSEVMSEERFGPLGSERYREYLQDINRSGAHVLDLINDLLDISKIEAGGVELKFEAVDLNGLLSECVSLMQNEANRERVIIRTSFSRKLPQIMADIKTLRQIVLNLLSNALKFTPAGGQVILSTAYMRNGDVELRVRDTGIGMSNDEIELALKPYRQLSTLTAPNQPGTGLGLPLTKAMTEANKAEFAIHSEPDEGTWIVVAFPSERVLEH